MNDSALVGGVLFAGLVIFLVGAVAWRLDYQRPLEEALPIISGDRRRRAWIHTWMIAALVITPTGLAGLTVAMTEPTAAVLSAMATAAYLCGAVGLIASLAFRLTVVPWAADRTVADGAPPDAFPAYDQWAGALYVVHMLTAYVASAVLGIAVLLSDALPAWLGYAGIAWGPGLRGRLRDHTIRRTVQPAVLGSHLHGIDRASPVAHLGPRSVPAAELHGLHGIGPKAMRFAQRSARRA